MEIRRKLIWTAFCILAFMLGALFTYYTMNEKNTEAVCPAVTCVQPNITINVKPCNVTVFNIGKESNASNIIQDSTWLQEQRDTCQEESNLGNTCLDSFNRTKTCNQGYYGKRTDDGGCICYKRQCQTNLTG